MRHNLFTKKMKIQKVVLLILFLMTNSINTFSQDQSIEKRIEEIKDLGKDSIIKMANNIIEKKYPTLKINSSDFIIAALSNKKRIIVRFKRPFEYIPLGKAKYFEHGFSNALIIDIVNESIDPIDYVGINEFYMPTDEERKKIEFLKNRIPDYSLYHVTVNEKENTYQIYFHNESFSGVGNIDKITGEGSLMSGAHDPDILSSEVKESNALIEIKN